MANKDLFEQAIADAKKLKEISMANAKQVIEEAFAPKIQEMFRLKLSEMEDAEDHKPMEEDYSTEESTMEEASEKHDDVMEETTLDEILAELELEEAEESTYEGEEAEMVQEAKKDEEEGEEEEETEEKEAEEAPEEEAYEVAELSVEEFKNLIRDVVADIMGSQEAGEAEGDLESADEVPGEEEMGGEETINIGETISLDEILAELEEAKPHQVPVKESLLAAGAVALFSTILSLYLAKKHDEKIALAKAKLEKGEDLTKDEIDYITKKVAADSATQVGRSMSGELTAETLQEDLAVVPAVALASALLAFYAGTKKDKAAAKKAAELEKGAKLSDAEAKALNQRVMASAARTVGSKMAGEPVGENVTEELNEAVKTINVLKAQLSEVNLLNAKLLYVNKIFKAKSLTESQKVKVVTAFDRATTTKEAKNIYETLVDSLTSVAPSTKKAPIKESLGFASKPIGSAPATPIVEADAYVYRMQQLAGIKKPNI